jgi:hypothetical protein
VKGTQAGTVVVVLWRKVQTIAFAILSFFAYIGLYNTLFIKLWSVYISISHGHKQAVLVLSIIQLQNTRPCRNIKLCNRVNWPIVRLRLFCTVCGGHMTSRLWLFRSTRRSVQEFVQEKKCILEFVLSSWWDFGVCSRPRTKLHRNTEKNQIMYFLIIHYSN